MNSKKGSHTCTKKKGLECAKMWTAQPFLGGYFLFCLFLVFFCISFLILPVPPLLPGLSASFLSPHFLGDRIMSPGVKYQLDAEHMYTSRLGLSSRLTYIHNYALISARGHPDISSNMTALTATVLPPRPPTLVDGKRPLPCGWLQPGSSSWLTFSHPHRVSGNLVGLTFKRA